MSTRDNSIQTRSEGYLFHLSTCDTPTSSNRPLERYALNMQETLLNVELSRGELEH